MPDKNEDAKNKTSTEIKDIFDKPNPKKGFVKENPEPPPPPPVKKKKPPVEKKPKGNHSVVVVLLVFCITFLTIFLCVFFDTGGLRTTLIGMIGNQQTAAKEAVLLEKEKQLNERQTTIQDAEAQQKQKEEDLKKREEDLNAKLNRPTPASVSSSPTPNSGMADTLKIYESMDAENVVAIINTMDTLQNKVALLKKLKKQKAAEVLALMDPKTSAAILKEMAK